jgi:hypothetical protein
MSPLLDQAVEEARKLPAAEQDAIGPSSFRRSRTIGEPGPARLPGRRGSWQPWRPGPWNRSWEGRPAGPAGFDRAMNSVVTEDFMSCFAALPAEVREQGGGVPTRSGGRIRLYRGSAVQADSRGTKGCIRVRRREHRPGRPWDGWMGTPSPGSGSGSRVDYDQLLAQLL